MNSALRSVLYHVHDPMCSWCWGYRRTWDRLREALPKQVQVVNVLGGLAPDSDQAMPLAQREIIAGYWRDVSSATGAEFNFDFWTQCTPRRSTYPACRAVLAAQRQSAEQDMIDAIQQAYYLRAMNPSDNSTLINLAEELGLNRHQFAADLRSPETSRRWSGNLTCAENWGFASSRHWCWSEATSARPLPSTTGLMKAPWSRLQNSSTPNSFRSFQIPIQSGRYCPALLGRKP